MELESATAAAVDPPPPSPPPAPPCESAPREELPSTPAPPVDGVCCVGGCSAASASAGATVAVGATAVASFAGWIGAGGGASTAGPGATSESGGGSSDGCWFARDIGSPAVCGGDEDDGASSRSKAWSGFSAAGLSFPIESPISEAAKAVAAGAETAAETVGGRGLTPSRSPECTEAVAATVAVSSSTTTCSDASMGPAVTG